jgi:hypothetical protein
METSPTTSLFPFTRKKGEGNEQELGKKWGRWDLNPDLSGDITRPIPFFIIQIDRVDHIDMYCYHEIIARSALQSAEF